MIVAPSYVAFKSFVTFDGTARPVIVADQTAANQGFTLYTYSLEMGQWVTWSSNVKPSTFATDYPGAIAIPFPVN